MPSAASKPYRALLLPVLHRRCARTMSWTLALCFATALATTSSGSVSWMLLSVLTRAATFFIAMMLVIMVRLHQIQFAETTTASGLETLLFVAKQPSSYVTIAVYAISAWIFSETCILSAPETANLSWVTEGQIYEKLKLNENVIYLRSHALIVALIQSIVHIRYSYSVVALPAPGSLLKVKEKDQPPQAADNQLEAWEQMKSKSTGAFMSCFARASACLIAGPFLYVPIRPFAWNASLSFARTFMRWNIPEYSQYDIIPPYHYSILGRTFFQALFLFVLWESCNKTFSIYFSLEPVKNEHPLTDDYKKVKSDASNGAASAVPLRQATKDPNGSLLNGLKGANQKSSVFSLWEFDIIARRFGDRRRSIFEELDRKDGGAWSQALEVCLGLVDGISDRINPRSFPTVDVKKEVQHLPKIARSLKQETGITVPAKPDGVWEDLTTPLEKFGKSIGSAPAKDQPHAGLHLRNAVGAARARLLTQEQQKALTRQQLASTFRSYAVMLLKYEQWVPNNPFFSKFQPLRFLQQTYARQIKAKVFGSPESDFFKTVRAVDAISGFVAASRTEDTYGEVSKSIARIWRSLLGAIKAIRSLEERTVPHWTDVNFNDNTKADEQVQQLLAHLNEGLEILLLNFEDVAQELGVDATDVEDARQAIAD